MASSLDELVVFGYIHQNIEQRFNKKIPNDIQHLCYQYWRHYNFVMTKENKLDDVCKETADKKQEKEENNDALFKWDEFDQFGFITTDFDQLSRGHTQWVNQIISHQTQCGIVITVSDDWCVMFWKFKKDNHQNQEITLEPILKMNTGLEVKSVAMNKWGSIIAVTCYDEEEEDGSPELQIYIDNTCQWCFHHHLCNPSNVTDKTQLEYHRSIQRIIISLPFEPLPLALAFTKDCKYVFIAMYSSQSILEELKEDMIDIGQDINGLSDHPIPVIYVNLQTKKVMECSPISQYLKNEEYVSCLSISPNGNKIAFGTSYGNLIVYHVIDLINFDDKLKKKGWIHCNEEVEDGLSSLCWSEDNKWIICGYQSGLIEFWEQRRNDIGYDIQCRLTKQMDEERINSMCITDLMLICGGDCGDINVYDLKNINKPILIDTFKKVHHGRMVNSVSFSKNYCNANQLYVLSAGAHNEMRCLPLLKM